MSKKKYQQGTYYKGVTKCKKCGNDTLAFFNPNRFLCPDCNIETEIPKEKCYK